MDQIKKTIAGYNKIAHGWHGTRRYVWGEVDNIILKFLFKDLKIMDLGCGNGRLLNTLSIAKENYLGVDPSAELIKICQREYPDYTFKVNDGIHIPCDDGSCDIVISIATLHHVPPKYQDAWLSEVYRVSSPNAKVIITVWLRDDSNDDRSTVHKRENSKEMSMGFAQHKDIRYVYLFDEKELKSLLTKNKFKILESKIESRPNSQHKNLIIVAEI